MCMETKQVRNVLATVSCNSLPVRTNKHRNVRVRVDSIILYCSHIIAATFSISFREFSLSRQPCARVLFCVQMTDDRVMNSIIPEMKKTGFILFQTATTFTSTLID